MKKKIYILLTLMLMCMGTATAADQLTVEDVTITQGQQATVAVGFKFDQSGLYAGYQFVLNLPEGISVVTNSTGGIQATNGAGLKDASPTQVSNNAEGAWNVACYSYGSTLKGTQNVLFTMTLKAATTLAAGEVLTATLTDIRLSTTDSRSVRLDDASFDITIAQPADIRITLDEASTTLLSAATNANVRVLRTISVGKWNTIVLPFSMTQEQQQKAFGNDVALADFTDYKTVTAEDEINYIDVYFRTISGTLLANHPYLIKTGKTITEFNVDGVDIEPVDKPTVSRGTKTIKKDFVGSYVPIIVPEDGLFVSGGQFWYSAGATKMKGFRAYFDFQDKITSGLSSRVVMHLDDEESTGIATMNGQDTMGDELFNLQGQRINKPSKGVFIQGNRKVVRN